MKKLILLLFVGIAASCSVSNITTTNMQNLASFESNSVIYVLPCTKLQITALAVRREYTPGPYRQYAKTFLGIDNVQPFSDVEWKLINLEIDAFSVPDADHFYSVKNTSIDLTKKLKTLQENGLIITPIQSQGFQTKSNDLIEKCKKSETTDLSIKRFYEGKSTQQSTNALRDSANADFPIWKQHLTLKTIEEKAQEAANFIFKIRKRRFKLLAGQYEVFPEGVALETSVEELNKLEKRYLELFIGKIDMDTIQRIFTITPVNQEEIQRFTLFRFSDDIGFNDSSSDIGVPVLLEMKDLEKNQILKNLQLPGENSNYTNRLIYRIPDQGLIKIWYGSHEILESEQSIYQLGALVPLEISTRKKVTREE